MNDKKEKGNEKTCRERRQKKKDKTMGTFPLSKILSGKRTKMRPKKKKGQNGGYFPTQRNFEWEKGQKFWANI